MGSPESNAAVIHRFNGAHSIGKFKKTCRRTLTLVVNLYLHGLRIITVNLSIFAVCNSCVNLKINIAIYSLVNSRIEFLHVI